MRMGYIVLITALFLFSLPGTAAGSDLHSLWEKSLTIMEKHEESPGEWLFISIEQYNRRGNLSESSKEWVHLEGELEEDELPGNFSLNPFTQENIQNLDISFKGRTTSAENLELIKIGFVIKQEDGDILEGTAWLEEETGALRKTTLSPGDLPLGVRRFQIQMEYEYLPGESWSLEKAYFEFKGSWIIVHRDIRGYFEFHEEKDR